MIIHVFPVKTMSPEGAALSFFSLCPQHLMCCWLAMGGQVIVVKELKRKSICENIKNTQE